MTFFSNSFTGAGCAAARIERYACPRFQKPLASGPWM